MIEKVEKLRKKYPKFIYKNFNFTQRKDNFIISFEFEIPPDIIFKPKIKIKRIPNKKFDKEILKNLIFHLGLIEMISYWKATCSPQIFIKAGSLNKDQIFWWKDLIIKGMGQFFYENKINFKEKNFLQIETAKFEKNFAPLNLKTKENMLVAIGGGKDSIVTLEILKENFLLEEIFCFSLNPKKNFEKILEISGCKNKILIEREIDEKLLRLNQKGYLNGHTPFSAYLAFLSILLAFILKAKYIVFSNEKSSEEGNLEYLGEIINHQWSKSFEFEKKFREYYKKYLIENIEYFSFLRPLYEIQITKIFSRYKNYFPFFLSCNQAFRTFSGTKKPTFKWCGNCPKCLFLFGVLYPFVKEKEIISIFKKNLFKDRKLIPLMLQLIGKKSYKPFECVGTKKENLVAFYLSWKKARNENFNEIPILLRYFEEKILPNYDNLDSLSKKILNSFSKDHNLPKKFEDTLKKNL